VTVPGSSVFLLLGRRIILVDAGPRGSSARILRYLRYVGCSPGDLELVILTHYHPDHAGGAAELARLTPARFAAHVSEAAFLRGEGTIPNPLWRYQPLAAAASPLLPLLLPLPVPVDLELHDGDELPLLGGLRVIHTPGHTPGSICLYAARERFLIAGDALQWKRGRLRPPSRHFSEDLAEATRSIAKLAGLDLGTLCFSHFPPTPEGGAQLRALAAEAS
jgi:glyoxylase-like metal-dependent hydrolase (beta-lactamase superfamily II)